MSETVESAAAILSRRSGRGPSGGRCRSGRGRRWLASGAALCLAAALLPQAAAAATFQAANISDGNLHTALLTVLGLDSTDTITQAHMQSLTTLDVSDSEISTISGLEHATNLTELDVSGNELTSLDLSANTALTDLDVSVNHLTTIDLGANTVLVEADLSTNRLTTVTLPASGATLTRLDLASRRPRADFSGLDNNVRTITNLAANTGLTWLDVTGNRLTTLDISALGSLQYLRAHRAGVNTLRLGASNTSLTTLDAGYNGRVATIRTGTDTSLWSDASLSVHGLEHATALTDLDLEAGTFGSNTVTRVQNALPSLTELVNLNLIHNNLSAIDLSDLTDLRKVLVSDNSLTSLTLPSTSARVYLDAQNNSLTTVNLSPLTGYVNVYLRGNSGLTSVTGQRHTFNGEADDTYFYTSGGSRIYKFGTISGSATVTVGPTGPGGL